MRKDVEGLKEIVRAGRAKIKATAIIEGGMLINVSSQEVYRADVAVYKDTIVAICEVHPTDGVEKEISLEIEKYRGPDTLSIDATGYYLAPGLIDGHIHVECSKLSMTSFANAVLPFGTTSVVTGLDEYISVSGLEGLKEVFLEIENLPLKVFWGAPYKTPYTLPKSTIAYNITKQTHEFLQQLPECFGVWETVREFVQEEDPDTLGALSLAHKNRLPIFGCAPMARGIDLNGYICSGVRLDHESYSHEEVVEKMRKGMHMLLRESSVTHFLKENIRAVSEVAPALARRISFCTDDVSANDLLKKGHLDHVVRLAISYGIDPLTAITMASINSAEAYRIDHLVGSISPGKYADILFIDDPALFNVKAVMAKGEIVAHDKQMLAPAIPPRRSEFFDSELRCKKMSREDFEYRVDIKEGSAKVLALDIKGPFVRKRRDEMLKVEDFIVQPSVNKDIAMVSVIERFGKNGNVSLGFVSGFTLKGGAMASSNTPDDNNIVVIGTNASDMALAVNTLREKGGGQVVVKDGKVLELLELKVGGICSDLSVDEVASVDARLDRAAFSLGCRLEEPMMYMCFLPITAIPDLAITDVGCIDCIGLEVFCPILELREDI